VSADGPPRPTFRPFRRTPAAGKLTTRCAKVAVLALVTLGILPVTPVEASSSFGIVPGFPTVLTAG
jgi:hypothetical protein